MTISVYASNHSGLLPIPISSTLVPRILRLWRPCSMGFRAGGDLWPSSQKPGMGKTTLLFHLLGHLRKSARTAFLFQKYSDSRDLLRSLMSDLGVNGKGEDLGRMYGQFNEVLVREARAGRRVVVVIDEAQNLEDSVFEAVRLLSNFEIPGMKLMQILLAG